MCSTDNPAWPAKMRCAERLMRRGQMQSSDEALEATRSSTNTHSNAGVVAHVQIRVSAREPDLHETAIWVIY